MSNLDQEQINDIVARFKLSIPVQVVALARELGLRVLSTKKWNEQTSGAIVKSGNGYAIWINGNQDHERQRFTIAHEIGHFVLHKELIGDGIHDDALFRSNLGGHLEQQASEFAANLLMPKPAIYRAIANGYNSIEKLSKKFRVSPSAMSIQLGIPS